MSIDDKLRQIIQIKSDIKDAIVDKGVEMPVGLPFDQYASKVSEISGGKSETYNVDLRVIDREIVDGIYMEYGKSVDNNGIITRNSFPDLYTANSWTIVTRFDYHKTNSAFSVILCTISDATHSTDYQGIMMLVQSSTGNFLPHMSSRTGTWDIFNGAPIGSLIDNNTYTLTLTYNSATGYDIDLFNENTNQHITSHSSSTNHIHYNENANTPISYNYMAFKDLGNPRYGNNTYYLKDSYIDVNGVKTYLAEM